MRRISAIAQPAIGLLIAIALAAPTASSARPPQTASGQNAAPADAGQDIVINGKRYKKEPPQNLTSPVDITLGRFHHAERAEIFARCVKHPDPELLRTLIDGDWMDARARVALGRLIQTNEPCYPDLPHRWDMEAADLGSCNAATVSSSVFKIKECRSPYDRAALLRRAIEIYAPDIALTPEETSDPAVKARFNAREIPRSRLRRGDDKLMFEIAVCMVRLQPEASVRLMRSSSTGEQYALEGAIIDGANICIGGAKKLGVDPSEFRDYISDAVYRWVVAARGVDSLIPAPK